LRRNGSPRAQKKSKPHPLAIRLPRGFSLTAACQYHVACSRRNVSDGGRNKVMAWLPQACVPVHTVASCKHVLAAGCRGPVIGLWPAGVGHGLARPLRVWHSSPSDQLHKGVWVRLRLWRRATATYGGSGGDEHPRRDLEKSRQDGEDKVQL